MTIAAETLSTLPIQWHAASSRASYGAAASLHTSSASAVSSSVVPLRTAAAAPGASPGPSLSQPAETPRPTKKPLSPSLADLAPRRYLFGWHLQGGHLCLHPSTSDEVPLPVGGPCRLTLHLHLPIPAEWDTDRRNAALLGTTRPLPEPDAALLGGALLKALSGLVIHETYQVVAFSLTRHYSLRPRLEIIAQPLGE